MKFKSVSPYTAWKYISKFLFLLIIPVLQQIFLHPLGFTQIFITMWPSLSVIFIIILISFFKYRSVKFTFHNKTLFIKNGLLLKTKTVIPKKNICAVFEKNTLVCSLFKSKFVNICSGISTDLNDINSDLNLILKKNDMNYDNVKRDKYIKFKVASKPLEILFMAVSWSNPAMSLIIAVPFINKIAGIIGDEFTKRFYSTVSAFFNLIKLGLPSLIEGIAYLILLAFFITAIILFFKYASFKTKITDDNIFVSHGLVNKYNKIIKNDYINAIVIKQSLIMLLLKIYSVYVCFLGMPKSRGEYNLLFAALKKNELLSFINALYQTDYKVIKSIRPERKRLLNFLFLPLCTFVALFSVITIFLGDKWYERIIFLILLLIVVFIFWWVLIRWFAFRNAGISFTDDLIIINSFKALTLYRIIITPEELQSINVKRNPLSRYSNLCKVRFNVVSGSEKEFTCKYLDYDRIKCMLTEGVES